MSNLLYKFLKYLVAIILLTSANQALAETVVIKVIEERQEKRKSTRWTLTEWLKIKERMKMMDVWLAMFSPKKPAFVPELNLYYRNKQFTSSNDSYEALLKTGYEAGAEMWLTNIVSASTGIRTLNIDLGFSGSIEKADEAYSFSPIEGSAAPTLNFEVNPEVSKTGLDLRIFGEHSQDSSIILSYGSETGKDIEGYDRSSVFTSVDYLASYKNMEMKLYLLSWLGLEGEVGESSGSVSSVGGAHSYFKDYSRYGGFIEVSLMRFEYFIFNSKSTFGSDDQLDSNGIMTGLKIQI